VWGRFCRYAWYKLFNLARGYNKNLTATDVQMMACSVVLAALSIIPYDPADSFRTEAEAELDKDRSVRMAVILGFTVVRFTAVRWLRP
jgi:translation initiation factor 3 subunit A